MNTLNTKRVLFLLFIIIIGGGLFFVRKPWGFQPGLTRNVNDPSSILLDYLVDESDIPMYWKWDHLWEEQEYLTPNTENSFLQEKASHSLFGTNNESTIWITHSLGKYQPNLPTDILSINSSEYGASEYELIPIAIKMNKENEILCWQNNSDSNFDIYFVCIAKVKYQEIVSELKVEYAKKHGTLSIDIANLLNTIGKDPKISTS